MTMRLRKHQFKIPFASLFSRLLFNFLIVMLIPIIVLIITYLTLGTNALQTTLKQQSENNILLASQRMQSLIEEYRHKTYLISTDEEIESVIVKKKEQSGLLFEKLFSIMSGDTYLATASIISKDGKVRLSTHLFPNQYDVRYFSNDTTPFFEVNRLSEKNASIITTQYRYLTQTNSLILLNILRAIRDENNEITGYVALDIHQEAFEEVTKGLGFSDLLLIDSDNFRVSSLFSVEKNGDFSLFPHLSNLTFPLQSDSYISKGTIVSVQNIKNTNLYIAGITETRWYEQALDQFGLIILLVISIGTMIALSIALFISRSIGGPIDRLADRMKKVEGGDLSPYPPQSSIEEFHFLESSFNEMVEQISTLLILTREEEAKMREAERKALEAQINPHFLYNTLNVITSLAKMNKQEKIQQISVKLGKLLRNAIDNRDAEVTLKESFSLVESYLTIQHIRYGEKLKVSLFLDPSIEEIKTPKLIIQPLIENAIIHGLEEKMGDWIIDVHASKAGNNIIIRVSDNGVGFDTTNLDEIVDQDSSHVGIHNIKRRLFLRYKENASFSIHSSKDEGTEITMILYDINSKDEI